jgi:serine protease Do
VARPFDRSSRSGFRFARDVTAMLKRLTLSCVLVAAGFSAGLVVTGRMWPAAESRAESRAAGEPQLPPSRATAAPTVAPPGAPDFTRVAGQAVRGVANISSLQVSRRSNLPTDPFFRDLFGDFDEFFGARDRRSLSLGSGVIISADGYLVTNNHVVGENVRGYDVTVALPDKREVKGRVVGVDPTTDLALLKISATGLAAVPWGDSNQLKIGEWVLAIGSPYQLNQTVTAGIVSATGRTGLGFADYEDFIQTDAAINRGNSGGALINARGELVGINTGLFSESGGYQGIGFAVPSNLAHRIVDDLKNFGEVRRGSIGPLSVERLTEQWAEELGIRGTNGALISRMSRNSVAYESGLRPGDVIVAFNGQQVDDPSQFFRYVVDAKIGSSATVRVLRNGRSIDFKLPVISSSSAPRPRSR